MSDFPTIAIYMTEQGPKRVDDLSRDELIAAVKQLGGELAAAHERATVHARLFRSLAPLYRQREDLV